jgi:hypothetical protein
VTQQEQGRKRKKEKKRRGQKTGKKNRRQAQPREKKNVERKTGQKKNGKDRGSAVCGGTASRRAEPCSSNAVIYNMAGLGNNLVQVFAT